MEHLLSISHTVLYFLIVLTVVVFVHEMGHFLVARWNGVRVEVFSIGFGKELWGFNDKHGTRWRLSLLPLGGYVKFYGDEDAASTPGEEVKQMTPEQKAVSFHHKRLGQRFAVVAAGPGANYVFSILIFAALFVVYGQARTPAVIGDVMPESAALEAGFESGDRIVAIDGTEIEDFNGLRRVVLLSDGSAMQVLIEREGAEQTLTVTPQIIEDAEGTGGVRIARLGVRPALSTTVGAVFEDSAAELAGLEVGDQVLTVDGQAVATFQDVAVHLLNDTPAAARLEVQRGDEIVTLTMQPVAQALRDEGQVGFVPRVEREPMGPFAALGEGIAQAYGLTADTLVYLKQIVTGNRSADELGGPLRIAQFSGQAAERGIVDLIMFTALLSVNLGLINLFPIPMLDGGHLMFYTLEAVRGRPLTERVQEYGFRVGLAMVLALMLFATWNDLNLLVQ